MENQELEGGLPEREIRIVVTDEILEWRKATSGAPQRLILALIMFSTH